MSDAPRPLPPYAHAAEPGDGFDVPVYNRAGEIIGYRQSVQAIRASNIVSACRAQKCHPAVTLTLGSMLNR